jgi:hypothetical protein
MKVKTRVCTAAFAAAMVSIVLALGGVGVVVSRTKVSPEAIELSVIHADDAVERAWNLPAAASFRHQISWQSNASLCGPSSLSQRFFVRSARIRQAKGPFWPERALLDWLLHNGPDVG